MPQTQTQTQPQTTTKVVKKVVKKSTSAQEATAQETPAKKVVKKVVKKTEPTQDESTEAQTTTTQTTTSQQSSQESTQQSTESVSAEFTAVLESLSAVSKQVKELTAQVKGLQRHVGREHKDLEKAAKGRRRKGGSSDKPKRAPSGFAKPTGLSSQLCTFLGVDPSTELARTDVTKKITTYVKEHGLQKPENKKVIQPDAKLGALLNVPNGEESTYFNLQKYMKVHIQKTN